MVKLQSDLIEIYNSLLSFNDDVIKSARPKPITVYFEKESNLLVFELGGKSVRLWVPIYYCLGLETITKKTYLLPSDFDYIMGELASVINSGVLLEDRVILSPENFGFDIYYVNPRELWKGPEVKASIRFISGHGWLFRWLTRRKYKI